MPDLVLIDGGKGQLNAAADALNAELPLRKVRVSVRKPGVAWAEWTGVTCERP